MPLIWNALMLVLALSHGKVVVYSCKVVTNQTRHEASILAEKAAQYLDEAFTLKLFTSVAHCLQAPRCRAGSPHRNRTAQCSSFVLNSEGEARSSQRVPLEVICENPEGTL